MKDITIIIDNDFSFYKENIVISDNQKYSLDMTLLNNIRSMLFFNEIKTIKEYFKILLNCLNASRIKNWELNNVLSTKQKNNYNIYFKKCLVETLPYCLPYYFTVNKEREELYSLLKPLMGKEIPSYNHNTATGRMKTIGGTNYLTMKKIERYKLKTITGNDILFELDFKSCEPYFYFLINNIDIKKDIYEDLKDIFDLKLKRDIIKKVIISLLYGASISTVKKISSLKESKLKEINNFLKINDFKNKLNKQIEKDGYLKNFYGRPIREPKSIINYYIQSSVADYCCLAFLQFYKKFIKNIDIHGIIHDALIFSCKKDKVASIENLLFLNEKISKFSIPVKIIKLSNNYKHEKI
jgi:hypothetical protein